MNYKDINKKFNSLPEDIKKQVVEIIYDTGPVKKNKLVSVSKIIKNKKRVLGLAKGTIKVKPGFDQPIKELKQFFG